ncbi:MAG: Ribosome-recycling factor [Candidatus Uhrbacteria bacterium GW2011_GWE2_45_35]|uniref:Ribosome-recycling factor n=1 Tax=Candidatus Uhrbacteria bacterium GW2011_GWE2_45_35 TaxID=1618993 RepID=A0A0G1MC47_9BACT|nr:MAG: Ribosome-recycling factor [Candidatus Uhrbacteria bacterium GW2011_GWE2_45_35]HBR80258.1 ribosome recycling factor [Candidatus Uhrbacteria bacterium]HCU31763.1 ribosome recycling factor [Candidatus Uhrbacteria bacterium]
MHPSILAHKTSFEAVIDHLHQELNQIRTGRATPALVENLSIEVYGSTMEMKGVASISVLDAKTLIIEPWDKNTLKAIEKAIQESSIGINPVVDGKAVRLSMPAMTEDSRKALAKAMKEKLEEAKVAARSVREKARNEVIEAEKQGEFTEDEKFKLLEELDKLTKEYTDKVEEMGKAKEEELMTV